MTRLEEYLKNFKPSDQDSYQYYKLDCFIIVYCIPRLLKLPLYRIEQLYSDFSTTAYCAGWMTVSADNIKTFDQWLDSSWGDGKFSDYYMETIDWKEPC